MDQGEKPRRLGPITGALFLIGLGVFFLLMNLMPNFDPWSTLFRYWPIVLILLGLGKMWDAYRLRQNPNSKGGDSSGTVVALLVFLLIIGLAVMAGRGGSAATVHDTQAVDLLGAKSVNANIEMPAGKLVLTGGSNRLLDADFNYRTAEGKPRADYSVNGEKGQLDITQNEKHIHFGGRRNDWTLRFGNAIPMEPPVLVSQSCGGAPLLAAINPRPDVFDSSTTIVFSGRSAPIAAARPASVISPLAICGRSVFSNVGSTSRADRAVAKLSSAPR